MNVKDGTTPLWIASQNGDEQIVQLLLEKGKPNVDLPNLVLLLIVFFFLFFFFSVSHFSIFLKNVKNGTTPLWIASQKGHEQIVELLLEKGKPNVDLPNVVLLLIVFFFFFFFSVSHFSIFLNVKDGRTPLFIAAQKGHEQIVELLLEKGADVDLPDQVILLIVSFSFFFFQFLIFLLFFNVKYGTTPLWIAAEKRDEQIVQILLEKGKPNVDLPNVVLLLILFFFFFFFFFHFLIFLFF